MLFENIQDCHNGGHLGYCDIMISANPNLHVTQMLPAKFMLKLTDGLRDVV